MFELPSQGCWSRGGHALPSILADLLTLSPPGGQIMPASLLLAPPPRIFRPSYGTASYGITDTDSSTNFEGFELDTNWTYYVCTLVLYFSTFLARVDLWSLWSDLLRSWLSAVLRMTLLCTLLVLVFCVFAVLDFKLTFSYRPQSNLMCP